MTDIKNDGWYYLEEMGTGLGSIRAYWVDVEGGCLLIQILVGTGATVRHLFPMESIDQITSMTTPDGSGHLVCVNPSFLVDSVLFEFATALEALRFHWALITKLG